MRRDHYIVNRASVSRMPPEIVALVGDLHIDRQALDLIAAEFNWSVKQFRTIYELAHASDNNLIAVFFDPKGLSLPQERALSVILEAVPGALPILCHRFAEVVDWPQLAEAGAFHSLRFPLDLREARQTLGFVWEARRHFRDIHNAKSVTIPGRQRTDSGDSCSRNRTGCLGDYESSPLDYSAQPDSRYQSNPKTYRLEMTKFAMLFNGEKF